MAPFYGWGSTVSRLEPLRGGSLLILRLTIFCIFQNSCMEWNICRKCTVTWCQRFPFNQVGKMESSQKNGKEVRSFLFFVKKQLKSKQYRDGYYWVQCAETKELPFHLILHIFNFVRLNSTWGITQNLKTGYPWDIVGNKAKRANLKTRATRKQSTSNFPKNEHFFP